MQMQRLVKRKHHSIKMEQTMYKMEILAKKIEVSIQIQFESKLRFTERPVKTPWLFKSFSKPNKNRRSRLVSIVLHNINLKNYQHDWQNHLD